jgi:hypothetical protein
MLCGNPDMVKDVHGRARRAGAAQAPARAPGQITVETFW